MVNPSERSKGKDLTIGNNPDESNVSKETFLAFALSHKSNSKAADSKLLNYVGQWDGKTKLIDGIYSTIVDGVIFYFFVKTSDYKKLYVSMTGGAGGANRDRGPFFSRWSFYPMMDGALICIDDPMIWQFNLHHGWFFGTKDVDYCRLASELIKKIANNMNIDMSDIIFYSSSSGGSASIRTATFIGNNCMAVVINPQLNLAKDGYTRRVSEAIGYDIGNDSNRTDLIKTISGGEDVRFFIIENIASTEDYKNNFLNLCNFLDVPPKFGMTKHCNVVIWAYMAYSEFNHNAQDWKEFFPLINYFIVNYELIETDERVIPIQKIATDMWFNHYEEKRKLTYEKIKRSLLSSDPDIKAANLRTCSNYFESGCIEFGEPLGILYYMEKKYDKAIQRLSDVATPSPEVKWMLAHSHILYSGDEGNQIAISLLDHDEMYSNPDSSYLLYELSKGECTTKLKKKPIDYLRHSAYSGNEKGLKEYLDCLINSTDGEKWREAYRLCKSNRGREGGYVDIRMGYLYRDGKGIPKDVFKAIDCFESAIRLGHNWAEIELARVRQLFPDEESQKDAFTRCLKLSGTLKGVADAMVAEAYYYGKGVRHNIQNAIDYYRKSLKLGNKKAIYGLVNSLLHSDSVDNWNEAYEICNMSEGDNLLLGTKICMHLFGKGCEKNKRRAIKLMGKLNRNQNSIWIPNDRIHKYEAIVAFVDESSAESTMCTCLQMGVYVDYIWNLSKADRSHIRPTIDDLTIRSVRDFAIVVSLETYNRNSDVFADFNSEDVFFIDYNDYAQDRRNPFLVLNPEMAKSSVIVLSPDVEDKIKIAISKRFTNAKIRIDKIDEGKPSCLTEGHSNIHFSNNTADCKYGRYSFFDSSKYDSISYAELCYKYNCGEKIYNDLKSKDMQILLPQWRTVGDSHKIAALVDQYKKTHNCSKVGMVLLPKNENIPYLFKSLDEAFILDFDQYDSLLWYVWVNLAYNENNIHLCGRWTAYFGKDNLSISLYANTVYDSEFFISTLDLPLDSKYSMGSWTFPGSFDVAPPPSKSILISPNAGTMFGSKLDHGGDYKKKTWDIFSLLTSRLVNAGYTVYTNVLKEYDPVLPGSIRFEGSIGQAISFGLKCQCVLSPMSGFSEAMAFGGCKVVVLHPNESSSRRYYLKNVPDEIQITNVIAESNLEMVVDRILDAVKQM